MTLPYLASVFSGGVPVRQDEQDTFISEHSVYRVELDVQDTEPFWNRIVRGTVHIQSTPKILLGHLWTQTASLLIRESGV